MPQFDLLPSLSVEDPVEIRTKDIERCAEDLRNQWALGRGPISNMAWLMENHGIIVAREDLAAESLDAVALQDTGDVYMILGAEKGAAARSRLDAAHELAHLVLHDGCPEPFGDKDARHKLMERQAFEFAGAFLLPAEPFADDLLRVSLDEFLALKPKWRVSVGAMIMRARQLELLSDSHERKLWMQYSRRGWKRGEPYDDEWAPELPLLLRRSLELVLSESVVSADQVLNETTLAGSDVEDLAGMPRGSLEGGSIPIQFRRGQPVVNNDDANLSRFRRLVN